MTFTPVERKDGVAHARTGSMLPPEVLIDLGWRLERTAFGAPASAFAAGPARALPGRGPYLPGLRAGMLWTSGFLLQSPIRLRARRGNVTVLFPSAGRGLRSISHGGLASSGGKWHAGCGGPLGDQRTTDGTDSPVTARAMKR